MVRQPVASGFASGLTPLLPKRLKCVYNIFIMDGTEKDNIENSIESETKEESSPIKRSFTMNQDSELRYETKSSAKKSGKTILLMIGVLIVLLLAGFFLNKKFKFFSRDSGSSQSAVVTSTPVSSPIPTPQPILNRSDWSFEVLNGTGVTGEAKKAADKIQALGYQVSKTGNADKSNYKETEILVKKDLLDKVGLVVADLKDTIKIASVAGELKDSTASARIIIGKDSI